MKKVFLLLMLVGVLAGCGSDAGTSKGGDDKALVVDKPIVYKDFTITVKSFDLVKDDEGITGVRMIYDWENTGKETLSPYLTILVKGFQDGVETDSEFFISDDVDLSIGQKDAQPGGKVTGAHEQIDITDLEKPLEVHLTPMYSTDEKDTKVITLDLKELKTP